VDAVSLTDSISAGPYGQNGVVSIIVIDSLLFSNTTSLIRPSSTTFIPSSGSMTSLSASLTVSEVGVTCLFSVLVLLFIVVVYYSINCLCMRVYQLHNIMSKSFVIGYCEIQERIFK